MIRVIFALGLLLSSIAQAHLLTPCEVHSRSKQTGLSRVDQLSLAHSGPTRWDLFFGEDEHTEIDLQADPRGNISGWVNGQRNFKLSGTAESGEFESATLIGQFHCGAPKELPVIFFSQPWKHWFHPAVDSQFTQVFLERNPLTCFVGDAQAALELVLNHPRNKLRREEVQITADGSLLYVRWEPVCIDGSWGNPDSPCRQCGKPRRVEYRMVPCPSTGEYDRP